MTQTDFGTINPNTKSGTQLATDLNNFRDTLYSQHLGSAAPSYIVDGLIWADNTSTDYVVRQYDGGDNIPIWQLDATNNVSRQLLDADEDSYAVMGVAADDVLSVYLAATESLRFNATGLRLGAGSAAVALDLQDKTDAIHLPSGTTAQRPGTPAEGMIRRNTTTGLFEGYDGSAWGSLGGAGLFKGENGESGDPVNGAGDIFRVHEQALNTSTTIDATENALAAGPLTVATGVTLTVTSGGNLSIV